MNKISLLVFLGFFTVNFILAQEKFKIDTLRRQGPDQKMVNFIILGDGYTKDEQDKFSKDAETFVSFFLKTDPMRSYESFFNIYAIRTISEESGAVHACIAADCPDEHHTITVKESNQFPRNAKVPVSNPKTIFGSSFDNGNIHRLVVPQNLSLISYILETHVPKHDMVLILVNSPFYGGSRGTYATSTVNMASNEIAIHEIGHSFAKLGDEYWAGNQYAYESPNRSRIADTDKVVWSHWIGIDGVGVYSYGNKDSKSNWYRPHEFCKMQTLKAPFCKVCQEQFVRKIHELTSPILRKEPISDTVNQKGSIQQYRVELALPFPNTLKIQWLLNKTLIATERPFVLIDPGHLSLGKNVLEVVVQDTTSLVRNPTYKSKAVYVECWNIEMDEVSQITAPKITWKDSLQTCYGTSQVLNIEDIVPTGVYRWYDKEEGGELLGQGATFHTPRIFENRKYYVEVELNNKRSKRTAVDVVCLSALRVAPGVKVKWDRSTKKYNISLVEDILDQTERYSWTEPNGNPLQTWDAAKDRYISVDDNSNTVIVDKMLLEKGIFVRKVSKSTTCMGDNYSINLNTGSK